MSGRASVRLLRLVCATAVIGMVVTASPALAEPDPGASAGTRAGAAGAGTEATAPAAAAPEATTTAPTTAAALLDRLKSLYQSSEAAGQTYTAAAEALKRQQAATSKVGAGLAKARKELAESRDAAGQLAREQYQGRTGLSPYLQLLLADDPEQALDEGHQIARASADQLAKIKRLKKVERRASALDSRSRAALAEQQKLAARKKKAHDTAESRLREAEALLAGFTPGQAADVAALDQADTGAAQKELVDSGVLSGPPAAASAQGTAAMAYAVAQVGKAYAWGAAGPDSFDCSGLTQQAWAHAGRKIPRTSQEQWRGLPKVSLSALRPGDLIVYFPDATHVALYIGNGKVVQAPRPGARVEISPLASAPVLGAVRPDSGTAGALKAGTAPKAGAASKAAQPADTSAR
ncbi:C40 family peptidase [Streptomyces sp. NPDC051322]|uniref:C40 family peptidase n=1 Tax=Streptomyces sp. NPDC051322 TaxID=3154645 RepID=UPI00344F73D0